MSKKNFSKTIPMEIWFLDTEGSIFDALLNDRMGKTKVDWAFKELNRLWKASGRKL